MKRLFLFKKGIKIAPIIEDVTKPNSVSFRCFSRRLKTWKSSISKLNFKKDGPSIFFSTKQEKSRRRKKDRKREREREREREGEREREKEMERKREINSFYPSQAKATSCCRFKKQEKQ